MLQNYKFPVKNVIYITPDNSQVKVIYEDNTFNETTPDDQVVLAWIGININTISSYTPPQNGTLGDPTNPGYVDPSQEPSAE
jgi:hypothetical protein